MVYPRSCVVSIIVFSILLYLAKGIQGSKPILTSQSEIRDCTQLTKLRQHLKGRNGRFPNTFKHLREIYSHDKKQAYRLNTYCDNIQPMSECNTLVNTLDISRQVKRFEKLCTTERRLSYIFY